MKRPWHPVEDEELIKQVNANKRTGTEEPAGMVNLEPLSHASGSADIPVSSPSFVNMSIIHGPGDMRPQQNGSSSGFPYKPLEVDQLKIRVVILKPGTGYSPIICDLNHVATANRPRKNKNKKKASSPSYTALSYTWGPPGIHKTIILGGIEVQVRKNLWQAMQHLRSPNTELHLWIDAICINQEDVLERNQQVSRMGTIYGMAKEVIVWLGPEEDDSTAAMNFIAKTTSVRKGQLPSNYFVDHLVSSTPTKRAISKVMERDYWKRVWIIQEIFRARRITIHCGPSLLPWPCLAKFFRLLNETFLLDVPLQISLLNSSLPANLTRHRLSKNHNLETLLEAYKHCLCSDPRDRIYSLIGLAKRRLARLSVDEGQYSTIKWITVDYTKSPVDMFYILFTNFMLSREWTIEGQRVHTTESRVRRMQLLQEALALKSPPASSPLTMEASIESPCSTFGHDEVSMVSPSWSRSPNDPEKERVLNWHRKLDMPIMFRISSLQPFLDTFTDDDFARVQEFQHAKCPGTRRTIKVQVHNANYHPYFIPILPAVARDDDASFMARNKSARFFTTSEGRLGIAPPSTRSGDIIYRFQGCDIALILRTETVSPGRETAILVGRAMLLKSEREVAWEAGSSMAKFQYVVPTEPESTGDEIITLPLGEWRSLTW